MIKGVGDGLARQLLQSLGDEEAVFTEKKHVLETIPGIGSTLSAEIRRPEVLQAAEAELRFVEDNKITVCFISDPDYPPRLKECDDAPVLFYYKGTANLNAPKTLSIVGTRRITDYGRQQTEALLEDLSREYPDLLIVSGLAYGVDICAHRNALKYHLPTVGVLAHGLDRIYPPMHRATAVDMLQCGGLLTDFPSGTDPDRPNFVQRNRIVAGLADATVVVESAEKGGSLITADIAFSYGREVYTFPGRVTDEHSKGCNALIRQNKAGLITGADDLITALGWNLSTYRQPKQTELCFDLTEDETRIVDCLRKEKEQQINELALRLSLPVHQLSPVLFELEMKGVVKNLPGGRYRLVE